MDVLMTDSEVLQFYLTMMGSGFIIGLVWSFFFDWVEM